MAEKTPQAAYAKCTEAKLPVSFDSTLAPKRIVVADRNVAALPEPDVA
jgi:hypothetical protein